MNPDSAIRPWLLLGGKKHGVTEAHNYRWADASARVQEPYFTYRVIRARQLSNAIERQHDKTDYTANLKAWQPWETTVRIELFRCINGAQVLAECCILAKMSDTAKSFFKRSGCAFREVYEDLEDLTPDVTEIVSGDLTEHYHQRIDVVFNDNITATLDEENYVVEAINIDLGL